MSLVSSIYPKWSVPRNQACYPHTTGTDSLKISSFVDNCWGTSVKDSPGILKCVQDSPGISLGKVDYGLLLRLRSVPRIRTDSPTGKHQTEKRASKGHCSVTPWSRHKLSDYLHDLLWWKVDVAVKHQLILNVTCIVHWKDTMLWKCLGHRWSLVVLKWKQGLGGDISWIRRRNGLSFLFFCLLI